MLTLAIKIIKSIHVSVHSFQQRECWATITFTLCHLSTNALPVTHVHAKYYMGDTWFHFVFWLLGANCIFYSFLQAGIDTIRGNQG